MADRSVTVRLKIDNSDFIRGLAQSAAAAKAFERSLGGGTEKFGSSLSDTGDEAEDFSEHLHTATTANKQFEASSTRAATAVSRQGSAFRKASNDQKTFVGLLNTSNDRMSFLVQTSLALGPALIPTFAAAIPLVTGFGAALGFAGVATGAAVIAFQGIGDAVSALGDLNLEPTAANLEKAKQAMDELGPAAQQFALFIHDLNPELEKLQASAAAGLFPGLTEGIEQVMTQAPLIQQLFESIGDVAGDIAAGTGGALAGPFWTDFIEFLRDDSRQILTDFASGIGHVVEGVAALSMAFQPLSEDFIGSFADRMQEFSTWAQGLSQTGGFQDFVAYIREAGPEFVDVLAAMGDAIVALAKAGAGIGLASLEVLQRVLEGIAAVLESPIGPPLLAAAAGIAAVSRAIALANVIGGSTFIGAFTALGSGKTISSSGLGRLNQMSTILGGLNGANLARAAGGVGLLATAFTDLGSSTENVVTGASLGALLGFGLKGAGVGALLGAIKAVADANDEYAASLERVQSIAENDPLNIDARVQALNDLKAAQESFNESAREGVGAGGLLPSFEEARNIFEELTTGESWSDKMRDDTQVAIDAIEATIDAQARLANAFTGTDTFAGLSSELPEITRQLEQMAPAMDQVGVSQEELVRLAQSESPFDAVALQSYLAQINLIASQSGNLASRGVAVGDALSEIAAAGGDAAAEIEALNAALQELVGPELDLDAALAAWEAGLDDFKDGLAKGSRSLSLFTEKGRQNRAQFRDMGTNILSIADGFEAVGKTGPKFTRDIIGRIEDLRQLGREAGFSKEQLTTLFKDLGLTQLKIELKGGKDVQQDIEGVRAELQRTGKQKVNPEVDVDTRDAEGDISSLQREMNELDAQEAQPSVTVLASAAQSALSQVLGLLNSIDGFSASATVSTTYQSVGRPPSQFGQPEPRASGGWIMGRGTATSDSIPAWLSDGEFVVNAKAAARFANTLQFINAQKFATGGQPGPRSPRQLAQRAFHLDDPTTLEQLAKALREVRQEAEDVTEAEQDLRAAREAAKESNQNVKQTEKDLEKARNEAGDKVSNEEEARIKKLEQRLRAQEKAQRAADKDQADAEKELSRQREQLAEATDRWREKQQELIDQAAAVQTAVAAAGAIFGGEGTSVTVGGMLSKLREAAKDAKRFNRNIAELRAVGLDERLVQQLLEAAGTPEGYQAAENLADASRQQIKRLNAAQGDLSRVSRASGQLGVETPGVGGVSVRATFTGPITTTDVTKLDQKLARRINRLVRMAKR